jgi:hypothetical protein
MSAQHVAADAGATIPSATSPNPTAWRVRYYRNPFRLALSASPWRSAWYLACYLVLGGALAMLVFGAASVAVVCAVTIAGLPLLIAASNDQALAARALLSPSADPLAPAREVLASPGPLSSLIPNER